MPFAGKPILGIVGGIASGKSFVSSTLKSLGCYVIDSDSIAHEVYRNPTVIETLRDWYGPAIVDAAGFVDRRAIGSHVFRDPAERRRLEALLHPLIDARREELMRQQGSDPSVRAFVWDSPLLIEVGLHTQCDALIYVDTPYEVRLRRSRSSRGWDAEELNRRERSQLSLDDKRKLATHVVSGDLDGGALAIRLAAIVDELSSKH